MYFAIDRCMSRSKTHLCAGLMVLACLPSLLVFAHHTHTHTHTHTYTQTHLHCSTAQVMHAFVDALEFEGMDFDMALRTFLAGFRCVCVCVCEL